MILKDINFKKNKLKIYIPKKVFQPTATTSFLVEETLKLIKKPIKILDLGCGCGIIGLLIARQCKVIQKIYASDYSLIATQIARKNFNKYKLKNDTRHGSLYSPWKNEKFDLIINDVSGVSSVIAPKSNWFKNVPCDSGIDGTNLTIQIIDQASNFLNKNGKIIFPVISLSNVNKVLKFTEKKFKKVKIMSKNEWFLPEDLSKYKKLIFQLKKEKLINFSLKFGRIVCYTTIVTARN